MAKIKIQGNASGTGTLTLTAPNTNADRIITLPDEDITLGGGVDGIVSTANATAITIDSSENVGIGTSSPNSYAGQTTLNINSTGVSRLDLDIGDTLQGFLLSESGYTGLFTPAGSNSLRFGTNDTERMRIDSAGRVTMPNQPAFQVKDLYTPSVPATGTGMASGGNVDLNRGNCYNTSNGRFTAPVTGAYLFSASVQEFNSGSGDYISLSFYKNSGGTTIETVNGIGGTHNNHKQLSHTAVLQLNAGDYVNMYCYRGARNYIQNYFNGHLIG